MGETGERPALMWKGGSLWLGPSLSKTETGLEGAGVMRRSMGTQEIVGVCVDELGVVGVGGGRGVVVVVGGGGGGRKGRGAFWEMV